MNPQRKFSMKPQVIPPPVALPPPSTARAAVIEMLESSEDEPITIKSIIKEKPKTKIVREFCRATLAGIIPEDEKLFATEI